MQGDGRVVHTVQRDLLLDLRRDGVVETQSSRLGEHAVRRAIGGVVDGVDQPVFEGLEAQRVESHGGETGELGGIEPAQLLLLTRGHCRPGRVLLELL